jgi:uncharacterized protein (TIGR02147 family)
MDFAAFPEFFKARDYRFILMEEFKQRRERRPKFSHNAFANQIGVNPSNLTAVLNRRYGISAVTAKKIALSLKYNDEQTNFFIDLVESEHGRTKVDREQAQTRLSRYRANVEQTLPTAHFELIKKWYYAATIELIKVRGPKISVAEIAKALRISRSEAEDAIEVLVRLDEISVMHEGFVANNRLKTATAATPNLLVRESHKQYLELAAKAIDRAHFSKRKARSTVFSFNSQRTEEVRIWIEKMHQEFLAKFCEEENVDAVAAVGIYFHRIDEVQQ